VAAFVVAPAMLAASAPGGGFVDYRRLSEAFRGGFVEYWRTGDRDLSPGLDRVVEYWFRYHLAKAVIAAVLLIVLVALGARLWAAFLRAGGLRAGTRAAIASAGAVVTMLALVALAAVMANVQGVVAPFGSLFPMLTDGASGGELAGTLAQVRQRLADSTGTDARTPPAIDVMINEFARYHVAMAVIASLVSIVLIGVSVAWWRRFAGAGPAGRRVRRAWGSFGAVSTLLALAVIVVVVANATTAADPAPALLALFEGSW
jgi:hypothetical protein